MPLGVAVVDKTALTMLLAVVVTTRTAELAVDVAVLLVARVVLLGNVTFESVQIEVALLVRTALALLLAVVVKLTVTWASSCYWWPARCRSITL